LLDGLHALAWVALAHKYDPVFFSIPADDVDNIAVPIFITAININAFFIQLVLLAT
jgi:hypothetical protein